MTLYGQNDAGQTTATCTECDPPTQPRPVTLGSLSHLSPMSQARSLSSRSRSSSPPSQGVLFGSLYSPPSSPPRPPGQKVETLEIGEKVDVSLDVTPHARPNRVATRHATLKIHPPVPVRQRRDVGELDVLIPHAARARVPALALEPQVLGHERAVREHNLGLQHVAGGRPELLRERAEASSERAATDPSPDWPRPLYETNENQEKKCQLSRSPPMPPLFQGFQFLGLHNVYHYIQITIVSLSSRRSWRPE